MGYFGWGGPNPGCKWFGFTLDRFARTLAGLVAFSDFIESIDCVSVLDTVLPDPAQQGKLLVTAMNAKLTPSAELYLLHVLRGLGFVAIAVDSDHVVSMVSPTKNQGDLVVILCGAPRQRLAAARASRLSLKDFDLVPQA